jgi:hypothetical protein
MASIINIVGLVLSLVGSIVLAWEAFSGTVNFEKFRERMTQELVNTASQTTMQRLYGSHRRQTLLARIGIVLFGLGFLGQLIAALTLWR